MINKELIIYSIRNLWNRKARSFLTIISILIGITSIFIFSSYGYGLYDYMNDLTQSGSADKIIIRAKGIDQMGIDPAFNLNEDDVKAVKKSKGVIDATGVYIDSAEIRKDDSLRYVFLMSYEPEKPYIMKMSNIKIEHGRDLNKHESKKVVLGSNYRIKDKIFSKPYKINQKININEKDMQIIGFMESVGNPQDDSNIYITNNYFEELYKKNKSYGWIIVKAEINNLEETVENIEKNLRNERNLKKGKEDFFVQSFNDMLENYSFALDLIIGFVLMIALISIIVSAINTANTMISSVLERTKEIGTMKAIGAKNSDIFKIFLIDSAILGFIAGTLGVLIGFIFTEVSFNILKNMGLDFLKPFYSFWLFFGCILFAIITGIISSIIPSYKASKINPVDALHYE
ncbi:MAG: ABC transporter permease [Nanoarchaeota archaeon]